MSWGIEHHYGQFGSPAPVVSPPSFPGTPSLQHSSTKSRKGFVSKPCLAIMKNHYVIITPLCTNLKKNPKNSHSLYCEEN